MKKQFAKRRKGDDGSVTSSMDRISQLPQPILHHILSLLSQKDAVRTSVLSKPWRYLWHGRLNVELYEHHFARNNTEFWSFLDKTLQRYHDQNLSLQQVLVCMFSVKDSDSESISLLEKWIPVVIMNMGIKTLNLQFFAHNIVYTMPSVVFQAEFLIELHLRGCKLNQIKSTDNVMLKHLKTFSLDEVHIMDETFETVMSSCPSIENVDLRCCTGLETIKLHKHHNLKDFDCWVLITEDQSIEIEATHTLETIHITNCKDWFLHHNYMYFPHLKSLNLYRVQLFAESFDNFSYNFPCLNELILDICHGFKEFQLLSCSIKRLTINMDPKNRIKALIDAPNILYFAYSGSGFLPSLSFTKTSNEWKSDISVGYKLKPSDDDASSWFLKLNKLLDSISQSHISLNLSRTYYNNLHIKDSYGGFYKPVAVEQLRLCGYFSSSVPAILNCFFRICRPRYLYPNARTKRQIESNKLVGFLRKIMIPKEREETRQCYFWLQDLEEFSIEVWDMNAKEWLRVLGVRLPVCASPKKEKEQDQIRFRMKWRDQLS